MVKLGLRSDDGYYTSMQLKYKDEDFTIETAIDGNDELILVTPATAAQNYLVVEAGILWGRTGAINVRQNMLTGTFPGRSITVRFTEPPVNDAYVVTTTPHLTFSLKQEIGICTGRPRTLAEIEALIGHHRQNNNRDWIAMVICQNPLKPCKPFWPGIRCMTQPTSG